MILPIIFTTRSWRFHISLFGFFFDHKTDTDFGGLIGRDFGLNLRQLLFCRRQSQIETTDPSTSMSQPAPRAYPSQRLSMPCTAAHERSARWRLPCSSARTTERPARSTGSYELPGFSSDSMAHSSLPRAMFARVCES